MINMDPKRCCPILKQICLNIPPHRHDSPSNMLRASARPAILVRNLDIRNIRHARPRSIAKHDDVAAGRRVLGPDLAQVVRGVHVGVGGKCDPVGCLVSQLACIYRRMRMVCLHSIAKLVCHSSSVELPRNRWCVPKTRGRSAVSWSAH